MKRTTKFISPIKNQDGKIIKHAMVPVEIESDGKYHYFEFGYNQGLLEEVKCMRGAKWLGKDTIQPRKAWRVDDCRRNNFNIMYLEGVNPFKRYQIPLTDANLHLPTHKFNHSLKREVQIYGHQIEMAKHMLIRRQCIISGEMGVGKTLSAFLAIENVRPQGCWYVAPKSALTSVQLEYWNWGLTWTIDWMTYDEMKKRVSTWTAGTKPPQMVIFDESSRVKTPIAQRSLAALHLAEAIRDEWGADGYVIAMSGSPAPKSPLDWYWQCEIAQPGYIKEGDIKKFENRLAVMKLIQDVSMKAFMQRQCWRDGNPNLCGTCGRPKTDMQHVLVDGYHEFAPGTKQDSCRICGKDEKNVLHYLRPDYHVPTPLTDEITKLYSRMSGLVYVKFKKDCLDLPAKIYRQIKIKPSIELLRTARIVQSQAKTAAAQLTLLRELSDGFQYKDVKVIGDECDFCHGTGANSVQIESDGAQKWVEEKCGICGGTGTKSKTQREIVEVDSPKLGIITDLLEENEDSGRIVLYAGFTASIDRICAHVHKQGWKFIRVDGRGWYNNLDPSWDSMQCLKHFQNRSAEDKVAFIGHPGSAGMGLTLTAASMIVYVSNDFNAESRIQSEDRIHRAGMDTNRGATIVDLLLLPTDYKVLDNLKRKRELQSMSLGELQKAMEEFSYQ